ncbi:MAG TPA: GNAT family N-acetyltransferase [Gaiellaceae bacterium]|nr:GNAT family N-acetyltransferase [Gaiellaceae bacterium]
MPGIEVQRPTDPATVRDAEALFDGPVQEAALQRFLSSDSHHVLLAYDDGQAVGMVTGMEMTHPDKGTEMFLYELGVAESHRGRGIGTRLVEELAQLARTRGCYGMWVLTDQDNGAARAAYERAGGTRAGDQVMYSWEF